MKLLDEHVSDVGLCSTPAQNLKRRTVTEFVNISA